MAYADQVAAIKAHVEAAGAALDVPILDVAIAAPIPKDRSIRIFYGGETDPAHMGANNSLDSRLIAERVLIVAFFSLAEMDEHSVEQTELELYTLKHELRTRILGDSQLGGMSTDLELSLFTTDWVVWANARFRTLEAEVITDYFEYTIAP